MDGAAVEAIADLAERAGVATLEVDGVTYSTVPLHDPRKPEPVCEPVKIHTLDGLVGFVKMHITDGEPDSFALHVVTHREVRFVAADLHGHFRQREVFAIATFEELLGTTSSGFSYGQFYNAEPFNIALQSLFVDAHDRAKVLAVVGNLADEKVVNATDDGISQQVTGRAGVVTKAAVVPPNPVMLAPYRTFREIEQPPSAFVLRFQAGREGALPTCALFEADGGAWRLKAIEEIATYLSEKTDIQILA